eukprot:TRINITY_DN1793_c0_g1_i1.p1 TRINITY_DN1793_c0_g1~~TRINITY_DN1793_c0_g1_i1.p1  ORF type:complete len:143 (-),score=25.33 TRINITY_DN1793_c0_g1_i1:17-445(-)
MCQSAAIMMRIAGRHNLMGDEYAAMLMGVISDFGKGFTHLCYGSNFETNRSTYLENVKVHLNRFNNYLQDKQFLCGETVSYPDFALAEMLDQHLELEETILDAYPNLKAYTERFFALPGIAEYRASDRFQARPLNNVVAQFK